jgi:hypothetical protein
MTTSTTKKVLVAGLCAATLGGSMVSFSDSAEARHRRGHGAAVAAGVIGGLALGAIAAGAASNAYAAPVAPGYAYPAYGRPAYGGDCYEVRRRYVDDWGRRFTRRETVCE